MALKMAAATRDGLAGSVFHSDHGPKQYTSKDYAALCRELGVTQSMGAVGTSAADAACESFHACLKRDPPGRNTGRAKTRAEAWWQTPHLDRPSFQRRSLPAHGREKPEYFETRSRTEEWTMGGQTAQMRFWDRPLHAMTKAFAAAGFRISVISEPPFVPEARELFPEELREFEPTRRFLCFLFFVLEAS